MNWGDNEEAVGTINEALHDDGIIWVSCNECGEQWDE